MGLRTPLLGIAETVGYRRILDTGIKHPLLQLQEESCDASVLIRQIVDAETLALQGVEEALADQAHPFLCCFLHLTELGGIAFEEAFLIHLLLQCLAHLLVFVLEDGTPEAFDLTDDVP